MRPTSTAAIALLTLILGASAVHAGDTDTGRCKQVIAHSETIWIADTGVEVGDLQGTVNGSLYLDYDDGVYPGAGDRGRVNLVLKAESGEIFAWVTGTSQLRGGAFSRDLVTEKSQGQGDFEGQLIDLNLTGTFVPGEGGKYDIVGTICPNISSGRG